MNTNESPTSPVSASKPVVVASWIGACFVLLTLTIGAAQLEGSGRGTAMAAHSPQVSKMSVTVSEFEYFPAQYVNRANELDDPIQAF